MHAQRQLLRARSWRIERNARCPFPSNRERDFVAELDFNDGAADLPSHGNTDLKHAVPPAELNIAHLHAAGGAGVLGRQLLGGNHHRDEIARSDRAVDQPALGVSAGLFRAFLGGTRFPHLHACGNVHGVKGRGNIGLRNAERRKVGHARPEQPDPTVHLVVRLAEIDVRVGAAEDVLQVGKECRELLNSLRVA